jgi:rubredoxin
MPKSLEAMEGEWECMECGYVEEGASGRRPKKCPDCGAIASSFEFFEYEDEDWDDSDELYEYDDDDLDDLEDDLDDDDDDR